MMIAARQQRLTRRRAQRRRVEPIEPQPLVGEPLERRRVTWSAERARSPEAGIVDHDHEHIGRPRRRSQRLDRGKRRVGILRVIRNQPHVRPLGNRQHRARQIGRRHGLLPRVGYGHPARSQPYIRSTKAPSPDRGEDNILTGHRLASVVELHPSGALADAQFAPRRGRRSASADRTASGSCEEAKR
jgi:hypothetical protein